MPWHKSLLILCLSLLIVTGCGEKKLSSGPIKELRVGLTPLQVEIADTEERKQKGLMSRDSLPKNQGMLFILGPPQRASFWMKNTTIPLSIAFIDREGTIQEIRSLEPLNLRPVQSDRTDICYALEVNRGWFEENGIKIGDRVTPVASTLSEIARKP